MIIAEIERLRLAARGLLELGGAYSTGADPFGRRLGDLPARQVTEAARRDRQAPTSGCDLRRREHASVGQPRAWRRRSAEAAARRKARQGVSLEVLGAPRLSDAPRRAPRGI